MDIQTILNRSAERHSHLCPRQVLGVRMGLLALRFFDLPVSENPKNRLVTIVESDGCFADGIEVTTGCTVGHRTLRLEDYGKIAATFIDRLSGRAIRAAPVPDVRERACLSLPQESRRYFAQLQAYQTLPDTELLTVQEVSLRVSLDQIVSRPGARVSCSLCNEEIINERELILNDLVLCRPCANGGYYMLKQEPFLVLSIPAGPQK